MSQANRGPDASPNPSQLEVTSALRGPLRVLIAGGGTGGHIFPALALAEQLHDADARNELLFVGSRGGLEAQLIPDQGHPLELLPVGKLRGAGLSTRLRTVAQLPAALVQALIILRRFRPQVVVGVGGYASGPLALAARLRGLPLVLLEQNAVPGSTNRLLARLARHVVVGFTQAAAALPAGRALLLGNPVRPELVAALEDARRQRAERQGAPTLLVLGGSQGAHALNQLMLEAAPALAAALPGLRLVHQTGVADREAVEAGYQAAGLVARVEAFIDDVGAILGEADLVLGRAGATTLAELCLAGLPALLVPYPYAADDHQAKNAAEVLAAGGALMIRQGQLSAALLAETLRSLLQDRPRLDQMGAAMRSCAYPTAARDVVELLYDVAGGEQR